MFFCCCCKCRMILCLIISLFLFLFTQYVIYFQYIGKLKKLQNKFISKKLYESSGSRLTRISLIAGSKSNIFNISAHSNVGIYVSVNAFCMLSRRRYVHTLCWRITFRVLAMGMPPYSAAAASGAHAAMCRNECECGLYTHWWQQGNVLPAYRH